MATPGTMALIDQGVQDPTVGVQTPAAATGAPAVAPGTAPAAPGAPLASSIMQSTQVANKINPGDWRENLIAGVTNALSGFAPKREAPVGAGIFSGIGQAAQAHQEQQQQKRSNNTEQQKLQMEQQKMLQEQKNQDREYQIKLAEQAPTIAEANSRTALNTAQAERLGEESIKDQIEIGRPLIERAEDSGLVDERGVTQADLMAGLKSGKYHPGETLGPVDGYHTVTGADGKERPEATHTVLKNATEPVALTQEDADRFKAAHVPGFENMGTLAPGQTIPLGQLGLATQQAGSNKLFETTLEDVRTTTGSKAAEDPLSEPGMVPAVQKFSHYMGAAGGDPVKALQAMSAQTKLDPKTGATIPNPDASSAQKIVDAFGGWPALRKYQNIQNAQLRDDTGLDENKARTIATAPAGSYSAPQIKQAKDFLSSVRTEKLNEKLDADNALNNNNPGDPTAGSGESYIKTLPSAMQGTVRAIGQGREDSSLLPRGKEKTTVVNALNQAFPGFDESEQKNYFSARTHFTTGKQGTAINAGMTAYNHLAELNALNTPASRVPGTPAYVAYQNKLGTVTDELGNFYGNSTIPGLDELHSSLNNPTFRGKAIQTQATSMNDKMNEYEKQWKDSIPSYLVSAGIVPAMPGKNPEAEANRDKLIRGQSTVKVANANPQVHNFSPSAWAASHPGGDVKAATAQATKQGFTVTQ